MTLNIVRDPLKNYTRNLFAAQIELCVSDQFAQQHIQLYARDF